MTDRIQAMRQFFITDRKHHAVRRPPADPMELARRFERENTPDYDRAAIRLCHMLEQEKPVLFEDERIAFTRTISTVPEIYTEEELTALKKEHWIHELGDVSNINVDYTKLLGCGFDAKREELRGYLREYEKQGDERAVHVLQTQISILDTVQNLADRYRQLALEQGNRVVAESLA
ncbi:hypothetical protein, partial [Ligaoa zhengdingensis]